MNFQQKLNLFFIAFLAGMLILSFQGFWKNPIYIWDEAIYANNALEMSQSNHFFFLTLNNEPDLYNTKPPLAIWLMVICIKIFGPNEFAVRLPSVVAFLMTAIVLIRFSKKYCDNYYYGILASIILIGTKGLMINHGVRSGDLDSPLILFSTLLCLTGIEICLTENNRTINALIKKACLYLGLGFFIKSTFIFLLVPGVLLSLLVSSRLGVVARKRSLYVSVGVLMVVITCFYVIEERFNNGYWHAAFFSEYQRAWRDVMPWHRQKFMWYFQNFFRDRFFPFGLLLIPSFAVGFTGKKTVFRQIIKHIIIIAATFFIIISLVPDKLEWYDLPVYPILALCMAISTGMITQKLFKRYMSWKESYVLPVSQLILLILFSIPILGIIRLNKSQLIKNDLEKEAYCLKKIHEGNENYNQLSILMEVEHPVHLLSCDFYIKAWKKQSEYSIAAHVSSLHRGDTVLYCQSALSDSLISLFNVDTIQKFAFGNLLVLK